MFNDWWTASNLVLIDRLARWLSFVLPRGSKVKIVLRHVITVTQGRGSDKFIVHFTLFCKDVAGQHHTNVVFFFIYLLICVYVTFSFCYCFRERNKNMILFLAFLILICFILLLCLFLCLIAVSNVVYILISFSLVYFGEYLLCESPVLFSVLSYQFHRMNKQVIIQKH